MYLYLHNNFVELLYLIDELSQSVTRNLACISSEMKRVSVGQKVIKTGNDEKYDKKPIF